MNVDAHIKSLTVSALTAVATLWLGWQLLQSTYDLDSAFRKVERHLLAVSLITAEAPANAAIESGSKAGRPVHGSLVDTLARWDDVDEAVVGSIDLGHGHVIDFVRSDGDDPISRQDFRLSWADGRNTDQSGEPTTFALALWRESDAPPTGGWHVRLDGNDLDERALRSAIRGTAAPWVSPETAPLDAYQALRDARARLSVTLPMVGQEVPAADASWALLGFALLLAILQLHAASALLAADAGSVGESASVLVAPAPLPYAWFRRAARAIWFAAVAAYVIMLSAPVWISILAVAMDAGAGQALKFLIVPLTGIVAVSAMAAVVLFARSQRTAGGRDAPDAGRPST